MRKIAYDARALDNLEGYIVAYRRYFSQLYSDTGIWSEGRIREQYEQIAEEKYEEILTLVERNLANDSVLGRKDDNIATFSWRTKTVLVSWRENE